MDASITAVTAQPLDDTDLAAGQRARYIIVDAELAHQRIDNFLLGQLKGVPKSRIYRMLRTGEVRVNKGRIGPDYRLRADDLVRIPPLRIAVAPAPAIAAHAAQRSLGHTVLYEDAALIALNKPPGLAVHGGSGQAFGVIEGLRCLRPEARYLELVHRLDKDTSGCLLVAKKRSALHGLHEAFRNGAVRKRYLTLVCGDVAQRRLRVEAPLQKFVRPSGERYVKVAAGGKAACTEFQRLTRFGIATLLEARPLTGRTHQIRVHAAHAGFPVAGDERYGRDAENAQLAAKGLRRLFLHAAQLELAHPLSGERLNFSAPLEASLQAFLEILER